MKQLKSIFLYTLLMINSVFLIACGGKEGGTKDGKKDEVSGEYYDWRKTGKPERPYMYDYNKLVMMKIDMAQLKHDSDEATNVSATFDDALEMIKWADKITRGVQKIVYLVGWQYNGHDTGYPSLDKFNEALLRPGDKSVRDGYLWLVKEAKKYNTVVSVHAMLNDAWGPKNINPNNPDIYNESEKDHLKRLSPLWDTYVKNDLLCRNADGSLLLGWVGDGIVCFKKEWEKGYLQKRIDHVTEFLNLTESKTIHIDAFFPYESPYHQVTKEDNNRIMRKIFRYWRNKGVDVTAELYHGKTPGNYLRTDPFIGLQPAAWWNDLTAQERAEIPSSLAAGGRSSIHVSNKGAEDVEFLFGSNMHGENRFPGRGWDVRNTPDYKGFIEDFGLLTIPYLWLNTHMVVKYDATNKRVEYSGGVVADYKTKTYKENGRLVREGDDLFLPLVWKKKELAAFSKNGYTNKTWTMPEGWKKVKKVLVAPITEKGLGTDREVAVTNGQITLSVGAGQLLSIRPAK